MRRSGLDGRSDGFDFDDDPVRAATSQRGATLLEKGEAHATSLGRHLQGRLLPQPPDLLAALVAVQVGRSGTLVLDLASR